MTPSERVPDLGTWRLLIRLWRRLRPNRRKQYVGVTLLMIVSAFAEVATIGAVIPFITVLVDPELAFQIGPVATLAQVMGLDRPEDLVLPLAVVFIVGALLATGIRLAVVWATTRLAVATGSDLSAEAYERTLYQPYSTHIGRHTSEITSGVVHKVEAIVSGMLSPLQAAVGSIFTMVTVTGALILIDPLVAMVAIGSFGGGYATITRVFRNRLIRNSKRIAQEQTKVVKAIQEGIGGIRDVIIDGTQPVFLGEFCDSDRRMRHAQGSNSVIQQAPRILMDGVAMFLISMLAMALSGRPDGITAGLPVLGALALGGQRLLPLYNQCYTAITTVLGHRALIVTALEILDQPMPATYGLPAPEPLELQTELKCENLWFRYAEKGPWVIEGLDLTIAKGSQVGLVGTTGCGKTTLLDLLMGLLTPDGGTVLADGQVLDGIRLRAWQRSVAHVPQHVFLADAPVAENIAFGVPADDIDLDRVRRAARQAAIADFIENESMGYSTMVGERGVRLSGGQRQRIGIARALYKKASVLILDEATSALDNQTEQAVVGSLAALDRELTVVIVAHRLTSLKNCDEIIEMSEGRVVGQGSYESLLMTSDSFRQLALAVEQSP
jgi:ATP-binding cassette subfamily B protein